MKYLIIPTGIAGSGKSYFAEGLAKELPAIWIGSDGVRKSMFGPDALELINMTEERHKLVFSALHYFTKRALAYGANVIYDAFNGKKWVREDLRDLAAKCDAQPITVWIKTPEKLAFGRATGRGDSEFSWSMPPERHPKNVAQYEPPVNEPNLIEIDGQVDFDKQFKSFSLQLENLRKNWGNL
jgi:predicted kinase